MHVLIYLLGVLIKEIGVIFLALAALGLLLKQQAPFFDQVLVKLNVCYQSAHQQENANVQIYALR